MADTGLDTGAVGAGDIDAFAVQGDTGTDVFRRVREPDQRRSRFECVASADESGVIVAHDAYARRNPAQVRAALDRFAAAPVLRQPMALTEPRSYPDIAALDRPLDLFVYLDFLRAWQVAEMAIARFESALAGPGVPALPETAATLRLLLDFNRIARARAICDALWPGLMRRVMAPGKGEDAQGNAAYALRLAGDLMERAGNPRRGLEAHEAALRLGETRFRRRRAIAAAQAAGDLDAARRHLARFERRWALPPDLAALRDRLHPTNGGDGS